MTASRLPRAEEAPRGRVVRHVGSSFSAMAAPDFRYLTLSNVASQLGQWIQQVAQGWLAYELTGSATFLGLVAASRSIPSFFLTLPAGVLADRWDRRRIIMFTQLVMAMNALALAFLVSSGLIHPWHLLASSIVGGLTMAANMPARQSLAPELAGPDRIANAVALNAISFNASRVLGPSIAGLLLAQWGTGACFAVQAGLLLLAIVLASRIGDAGARHLTGRKPQGSMWANLIEGVHYIRSSPTIVSIMATAIIPIYLETVYQQLLPVFAGSVEDGGGPTLAKMVTAVGVGSLVGAFVTAALSEHPRKGIMMLTIGMGSGVTLILFAISGWMPFTLTMLALTGLTQAVTMAMGQTMVNLVVANEYRGRVMAVYMMLWSSSPLAMLPAGWATDHFGAAPTVMVSGVLVLLFFLVQCQRRGVVWNFQERPRLAVVKA